MSRKVLLLTYHFPPSSAVAVHRMLGLARNLPRFGWEAIIVAPPQVPGEPQDPALVNEIPAGTIVEHVPFATGFLGKVQRRLAPMGHWLPRARRASLRMIREHRPDAIYTSGPPHCIHNLGALLKAETGIPWLACLRDPLITGQYMKLGKIEHSLGLLCERIIMRNASYVLANTPINQCNMQAAYPEYADKVVLVTNGYDAETLGPPETARPVGSELNILHAGELYAGRDPRCLLDAMQQLTTLEPKLRLTFLGRSTEGIADLPSEICRRGLETSVELRDLVPHAEALKQLRQADVMLLIQKKGIRIGVPAKLYEYLGIGRPILSLSEPDGDIAWVLRTSGVLHRIARPEDTEGIRRALVELTEAIRTGEPVIKDPEALERFTRAGMARRVAECLDSCAKPIVQEKMSHVLVGQS